MSGFRCDDKKGCVALMRTQPGARFAAPLSRGVVKQGASGRRVEIHRAAAAPELPRSAA